MVRTVTVTKTVDRYVQLPAELTETLASPEIPDGPLTWRQITDLALQYRAMVEIYEARMTEIRKIGATSE